MKRLRVRAFTPSQSGFYQACFSTSRTGRTSHCGQSVRGTEVVNFCFATMTTISRTAGVENETGWSRVTMVGDETYHCALDVQENKQNNTICTSLNLYTSCPLLCSTPSTDRGPSLMIRRCVVPFIGSLASSNKPLPRTILDLFTLGLPNLTARIVINSMSRSSNSASNKTRCNHNLHDQTHADKDLPVPEYHDKRAMIDSERGQHQIEHSHKQKWQSHSGEQEGFLALPDQLPEIEPHVSVQSDSGEVNSYQDDSAAFHQILVSGDRIDVVRGDEQRNGDEDWDAETLDAIAEDTMGFHGMQSWAIQAAIVVRQRGQVERGGGDILSDEQSGKLSKQERRSETL